MSAIRGGGFYCSACGAVQGLGSGGIISCRNCGHLGLRGYSVLPRRVRCADPDCDWRGWDDGGVNDDLGRHEREHERAINVPT